MDTWPSVQHDGREVTVTGIAPTSCTPRARARQYVEALLGRAIATGEEIEPETLYSAECQLMLTVVPLDAGGTVDRIERVLARIEDGTDDDLTF
jgi:hypothetical protein